MTSVKAETKVGVKIIPTHSQVVLVSLLAVAVLFGGCAVYLLTKEIEQWWWFFVVAVLALLTVPICWWYSKRDMDLSEAHPTTILLPDGTQVTTDTRVLSHRPSAKELSRFMTETLDRKPLPKPSGTVDSSFNPVPNTQEAAQATVDKINYAVKEMAEKILGTFQISDPPLHKQENISLEPPSTKQPPKSLGN